MRGRPTLTQSSISAGILEEYRLKGAIGAGKSAYGKRSAGVGATAPRGLDFKNRAGGGGEASGADAIVFCLPDSGF